jgi:hypothetical protein
MQTVRACLAEFANVTSRKAGIYRCNTQKDLRQPEGQATVADVQVMATGGVDIIMFDTHEV